MVAYEGFEPPTDPACKAGALNRTELIGYIFYWWTNNFN